MEVNNGNESDNIEKKKKKIEIYGLPKTHKPDILLRPIIYGIRSAPPNNIAKLLAKILFPQLGTISDTHFKNPSSLLKSIDINIKKNNKYLASLNIKSLYSNTPVNRCIECLDNYLRKTNAILHTYLSTWILTHDIWKHWTAISTLLGLISSVYRDFHLWRSNQWPQIAEPKLYNWTVGPYRTQVTPN